MTDEDQLDMLTDGCDVFASAMNAVKGEKGETLDSVTSGDKTLYSASTREVLLELTSRLWVGEDMRYDPPNLYHLHLLGFYAELTARGMTNLGAEALAVEIRRCIDY